ncbi:MAG: hypothetical protein LQ344_005334 [Seirophora lacunosa]|nr:MAG: hypothetical protein LQ344_005334 [Seirophora lacunosa]
MDRYGRPLSPGGRRVAPPGRSSTGTLVYPSSFDPTYAPTRSTREISTVAAPRTSADRVLQPRAVPRYRPESPPRKQSRDDYVVRPRRLTHDPNAAEARRPLSVIDPGPPNRSARPVITTSDRPSSPLNQPGRTRPDEPYYLQPASSTRREHRRNYSFGSADPSRDGRERAERGGYRSSGIGGGRTGYNLNQPLVRQPEDRDRPGYEYTDRREQMYRDTEPRPRPRTNNYPGGGRERPLSMTGLEDYQPPRVERSNRDAGPPVSMRGFGAIGRSGSQRQGPSSRDSDYAPSDFSRDDYERRKAHISRVALHQDPGTAYEPIRDDDSILDDPRDRRPRKTVFEDELVDNRPREGHDDQYERIRRAKAAVEEGQADVRRRDRYPEEYERGGEEVSRKHRDRGLPRDEREEEKDRRRREDAVRDARGDNPRGSREDVIRDRRDEIPRDRRDEVPRERRDDGHRHRRDDVPKEKRYHGDPGLDNGIMVGGAAAAAGLAAEAARSHHRHKGSRDDRDYLAPKEPAESNSASTVSREESDEERRERRRRRRERREREDREARELVERERRQAAEREALPKPAPAREPVPRDIIDHREELLREPVVPREPERRRDAEEVAPSRDLAIREQPSSERHTQDPRIEAVAPPVPRPRHHRHHSRSKSRDSFSDSDSSISSTSSTRRPRTVRLVTPTSERAPSQPPAPKSILRAPREKFPEDPAPVREGVAPLKDAGKKGIPPNARWTKIDRKLVNPEALEAGNERYEERVDYVIVLRVLTKEEIEQYAAKTQELRNARAAAAAAGSVAGQAQGQGQGQAQAPRSEASGIPEWG